MMENAMDLDARPAADYPVADLVGLMNRGFENYFVPIQLNTAAFLSMIREDSVDLTASRVVLMDEKPVGIALIARRGWASRLAAMGIASEARTRGVGSWIVERILQEARERNDREMVLEVIEQNEPAVRLYQKYRFETVRRLVSFVGSEVKQGEGDELEEMDLRELGAMINLHGISDLPWQISGETIAQMNPPARAYRKGRSYAAISNPEAEHIVFWSVLVEKEGRGHDLAEKMIHTVMVYHGKKTWHVPALCPEEIGVVFERAGFEREKLSQWQMRIAL